MTYHTNNDILLEATNLKKAKKEAYERWSPSSSVSISLMDANGNCWTRDFTTDTRHWELGDWYKA